MNFLLEIYSEEIPAFDQISAAKNIAKYFGENEYLKNYKPEIFFTPNRLAVVLKGLSKQIIIEDKIVRGPALKAPQQALDGFLAANKISIQQTYQQDGYYCHKKQGGVQKMIDVLPSICLEVLGKMSNQWEKSMKINNTNTLWIRPIQLITAILDGKIINFEFADIKASNQTKGHKFFGCVVKIKHPLKYQQIMQKQSVIASFEKRVQIIKKQIAEIEKSHGVMYDGDENLIEENAMLCEYPVLLASKIKDDFINNLPHKLITLTIKQNQRYLMFKKADGEQKSDQKSDNIFDENLSAVFAIVSNNANAGKCKQTTQNIIEGNMRVLNARLSDAKFFIECDASTGLDAMGKKLEAIEFAKDLGSVENRVSRMLQIAESLFAFTSFNDNDKNLIKTAIKFAKNDLASITVGEFAELQGYTGAFILQMQGDYPPQVIEAIKGQYSSEITEGKPVANFVKFVENLEKLAAFFSLGQIPTSSKDPFALKRAANVVCELLFAAIATYSKITIFTNEINIPKLLNAISSLYTNFNSSLLQNYLFERFKLTIVEKYIITNNWGKEYFKKFVEKNIKLELNSRETYSSIDTLLLYLKDEDGGVNNFHNFIKSLERLKGKLPINFKANNDNIVIGDDDMDFLNQVATIANYHYNIKAFTATINNFCDNVIIERDDKASQQNVVNLVHKVLQAFNNILV